ncbi:zinc-binding dehydrogenase [Halalkalibacterium halodurans]|uniref:Sorbitol dehydrogenase n=1 Tax=Halalkalibacterium halodurans (strain ATCC BAA-125 / DSM 18197 / FERM 7344 / JCM 9153 / C-125) TaxID=272558 RepID=DHSO_HALH5|nr:zinc-binding dehydrogenase [Halalkalibacterium halodurans]Q9Z9U1.1 RecName: Full=Sorbitol dehydrogenase; Short=SDH; AltName: Full=Glucitol dehydrogenase; AltName: Full=L-iditol 2-dehydrogenase; AltName: Full=Polyol dehydrogenase; AltName: Full=Xylitol dehydrogenase [Halalkalibacterium halodurans C-125]MED4081288.1 zinc-binding dehydrogenase [Halalkalibacterium halodurans]MED4084003.1 zinc-binding dehydrogenase [Halalkalibacterium halodurans]MED4105992.1 zinc-binding dehydrogenase [Halalkalib
MKALVKTQHGTGHFAVQEKPEPTPGKHQVKIKVKYTGVCGSDIHTYEGHYPVAAPVTLGHEFSGEIVELGEGVTGFNVGDRVTSETTYSICGKCSYCTSGDYNLCSHRKGLGNQQDGSFAKYVIARQESLHHLPAGVDDRSAAMTEPLACTHHAIAKTSINKGDLVVVTGPGPIGLLAAQVAKSHGGTVIITGLSNDQVRLKKAKEVGIDYAIDTQEVDIKELVSELTDGYGADVVLECSGAVPAAKQGIDLLRKKGQYAQVGLFAQPEIQFNFEKIIQKEISVVGSRSQKPADWEPALSLLNEKKVNAKTLVTHEYTISEWDKAYHAIKSGEAIKVLLTPID